MVYLLIQLCQQQVGVFCVLFLLYLFLTLVYIYLPVLYVSEAFAYLVVYLCLMPCTSGNVSSIAFVCDLIWTKY